MQRKRRHAAWQNWILPSVGKGHTEAEGCEELDDESELLDSRRVDAPVCMLCE